MKRILVLTTVLAICMLFACCEKSVEPAALEPSVPAELTFGKPYAATIMLEGLEEPVSYTDVVSPLGYTISIDASYLEGRLVDDVTDVYNPVGEAPLGLGGDYALLITKVTPGTALSQVAAARQEIVSYFEPKGYSAEDLEPYFRTEVEDYGINFWFDFVSAREDGIDGGDLISVYRLIESEGSVYTLITTYRAEAAEGIGRRLSYMEDTFRITDK